MKKTIVALIIVSTLIIAGFIGYIAANKYAQKRAEDEIEAVLKKANLYKEVSYGRIKANLFSNTVVVSEVEWYIKKHGNLIGKFEVKKIYLTGKPEKTIKAKFKDATLINLNVESPEELINKPILTIQTGYLEVSKGKDRVHTLFEARRVLLNDRIFEIGKESKKLKELLENVLKIKNPFEINIETTTDAKNNLFAINRYRINWLGNLLVSYSLKLNNVDINGFKKASQDLNGKNPNPLIVLNYLSKLYQIKPDFLRLEVKNEGLINRLLEYIAKNEKTNKETLIKQVNIYLSKTPFKNYSKPITDFLEGNSKTLKVKIVNSKHLAIGDILQSMQKTPLYSLLDITITN